MSQSIWSLILNGKSCGNHALREAVAALRDQGLHCRRVTCFLWFGDELVGLVRGMAIYFVHSDHLGRPEIVTNTAKALVWPASNYAFDRAGTQDAIGGLSVGSPGQYCDKESNLWYNINRYYDARLGAYTQSDPIGLAGRIKYVCLYRRGSNQQYRRS